LKDLVVRVIGEEKLSGAVALLVSNFAVEPALFNEVVALRLNAVLHPLYEVAGVYVAVSKRDRHGTLVELGTLSISRADRFQAARDKILPEVLDVQHGLAVSLLDEHDEPGARVLGGFAQVGERDG